MCSRRTGLGMKRASASRGPSGRAGDKEKPTKKPKKKSKKERESEQGPPKPKRPVGRPRLNRTPEEKKRMRREKRLAQKNQIERARLYPYVSLKGVRVHDIVDGPQSRDTVHAHDHVYVVVDQRDFSFYKIGPTRLPFASGYYAFSVEVARQSDDHASGARQTLDRACRGAPRAVRAGTFRIASPVPPWPATVGLLTDVMRASFPHDTAEFERSVGGAPDAIVEDWDQLDRQLSVAGASRCTRERCAMMLRECLLGAERFFDLCRYFSPGDLIRSPNHARMLADTGLPPKSRAERNALLVLYKFLRGGIRDGAAFLAFLGERVQDPRVDDALGLSPLATARWFDRLRSVYVEASLGPFESLGNPFPACDPTSAGDAECIEYLQARDIVRVGPAPGFDAIHPVKWVEDSGSDAASPSSYQTGGRGGGVVCPVAAVCLAQKVIESVVVLLSRAFEAEVVAALDRDYRRPHRSLDWCPCATTGRRGRASRRPSDCSCARLHARTPTTPRSTARAARSWASAWSTSCSAWTSRTASGSRGVPVSGTSSR